MFGVSGKQADEIGDASLLCLVCTIVVTHFDFVVYCHVAGELHPRRE